MSGFVSDSEVSPGGAFVPMDGPANRTGPPPTTVDACPPFLVVHNPARFTVIAGRVLPQFERIPLVAGLNGCDEIRDRVTGAQVRVTSGIARSDAQDRGKIVIPHDAIPDSHVQPGQPKSYLWRPTGRPDVNLLIYTKCYPGSPSLEVDEVRYVEWVDYLVGQGIIQPAPAYVLRRMISERSKERDVLADKAVTQPSLKPEVDKRSKDIECIQAELARREAPGAVAPSSGGGFVPDVDAEPPAKRGK